MTAPEMRTPGGNLASAGESTDTAIVAHTDENCNERLTANVICAFELRGFSVHRLERESFLVVRWGLSKCCPDLRTLIAFGKQVGATC